MAYEKLVKEEQKALHIDLVSDTALYFESGKKLEFYKYDDGTVEVEIIDMEENVSYMLTKDQIAYLKGWL